MEYIYAVTWMTAWFFGRKITCDTFWNLTCCYCDDYVALKYYIIYTANPTVSVVVVVMNKLCYEGSA